MMRTRLPRCPATSWTTYDASFLASERTEHVIFVQLKRGGAKGSRVSLGVNSLKLSSVLHEHSEHIDESGVTVEQLGEAGHVVIVPRVDKSASELIRNFLWIRVQCPQLDDADRTKGPSWCHASPKGARDEVPNVIG